MLQQHQPYFEIRYVTEWINKKKRLVRASISLEEAYSKTAPGNWLQSKLFIGMDAAYKWNKPPSFFGVCSPKDDPVFMMAYLDTLRKMEAVEDWVMEQRREEIARNA